MGAEPPAVRRDRGPSHGGEGAGTPPPDLQTLRAPTRRSRLWKPALLLFKLALLAAIAALTLRILQGLDWSALGLRIRDAGRPWLALVVVAMIVRFLAWGERWRCALHEAGIVVAGWLSLGTLFASAAVNSVTPTARVFGGLLRARYLASNDDSRNFGHVYGTVLYDQIQHQLVTGLLSLLALILVGARAGYGWLVLGGSVVLLLAGLAARRWWPRAHGRGTIWLEVLAGRLAEKSVEHPAGSRRASLLEHGRDAVDTMRRLSVLRSLAVRSALLGVAFFLVNAGAQWLAFRAIGTQVPYSTVVVVVALGTFAGIAAGTPGGIGAAEGAMIAAFVALEVDRFDATAGTLLFRGVHYLVIFSIGLPFLVGLELRHRRRS
ncbi:MAG TPA: lysylphosphatidylglycerol synthase transmembrane domain-containing protein [Thermoanaerobaculia bacterium]|nr:lysylphosphatidylglycerol synthase transmembrane domain-containing protein [Thermoanaerobaculia bacterium]